MAAHSVTILLEMASTHKLGRNLTLHAFDYAPGMDELDQDVWRKLRDSCQLHLSAMLSREQLQDAILSALGTQISKWEALGKPRTHEDWARAKSILWRAREIKTLHHSLESLQERHDNGALTLTEWRERAGPLQQELERQEQELEALK